MDNGNKKSPWDYWGEYGVITLVVSAIVYCISYYIVDKMATEALEKALAPRPVRPMTPEERERYDATSRKIEHIIESSYDATEDYLAATEPILPPRKDGQAQPQHS